MRCDASSRHLRENGLAHLEKKVADLDARMDRMGDRMDRMGDRMSRMDERIKEVRTEIRETRRELKGDILATEGRLLEALERDSGEWRDLLASVPPGLEGHRYAPGKWSIREVVGHVIDAERMFGVRAMAFARGDRRSQPSHPGPPA